MTDKPLYSKFGMAILEYLIEHTEPQSNEQILKSLNHEGDGRHVGALYSALIRTELIEVKDTVGGRARYKITRKGRDHVKNKDNFLLVNNVGTTKKNFRHPDTGELLTEYQFNKIRRERGELPSKPIKNKSAESAPLPLQQMLPSVSITADNLMNNISTVIHENAAYRELMINVCNMIAAPLGMKVVPRNEEK